MVLFYANVSVEQKAKAPRPSHLLGLIIGREEREVPDIARGKVSPALSLRHGSERRARFYFFPPGGGRHGGHLYSESPLSSCAPQKPAALIMGAGLGCTAGDMRACGGGRSGGGGEGGALPRQRRVWSKSLGLKCLSIVCCRSFPSPIFSSRSHTAH